VQSNLFACPARNDGTGRQAARPAWARPGAAARSAVASIQYRSTRQCIASLACITGANLESADPLDANEWQEGQCRSFWQVRPMMAANRGHLRAMRLLPSG
jgi:hypothetical protein